MGRITWQWMAMLLVLCAALVICAPAAYGEDSSETCPTGTCPVEQPDPDEEDTETAAAESKEEEVLPLDLGVGSAVGSGSTDPLANGGVTVVKDVKDKPEVSSGQQDTGDQNASQLMPVVPPMWTPNSDRFLLRDRQETLSLQTEVDTTDTGDYTSYPDPPRQKPKPQRSKPPALPEINPIDRQETIVAENPVDRPVEEVTAEVLVPGAGLIGNMDLPGNDGTDVNDELTPSQRFNEDEMMAAGSDSYVLDGEHGTEASLADSLGLVVEPAGSVGVINGRGIGSGNPPPGDPSLADVLNGNEQDENLGSALSGVSMGRSLAIMLGLVALLFLMFGAAKYFKGGFKVNRNLPLSVMETISLGSGRQITIMEMGESALILGVTPQSINLLDKVPLGLINSSYQGTVNAIIDKESRALPDDWAQRPQFTVPENTRSAQLVPPLSSAGTYGPSGRRVSVSELRQARSAGAPATFDIPTNNSAMRSGSGGDDQTKSELIGRLRDQLNRLER